MRTFLKTEKMMANFFFRTLHNFLTPSQQLWTYIAHLVWYRVGSTLIESTITKVQVMCKQRWRYTFPQWKTDLCRFMFCLSDWLSVEDLAAVQRKLYTVHTEWYNLGLELGQRVSTLDSIDAKCNGDPSRCFRQVLKEWLKGVNPPPIATWQAMVKALKSPTVAQYQVAEQIQSELTPPLSIQPLSPQPLSPQPLSPLLQSPQYRSQGLLASYPGLQSRFEGLGTRLKVCMITV